MAPDYDDAGILARLKEVEAIALRNQFAVARVAEDLRDHRAAQDRHEERIQRDVREIRDAAAALLRSIEIIQAAKGKFSLVDVSLAVGVMGGILSAVFMVVGFVTR